MFLLRTTLCIYGMMLMRQKLPENATKEEVMADAREVIGNEIDGMGNFSLNIIGMRLRSVEKRFGTEAANSLVDEFDLEDYGFNKE